MGVQTDRRATDNYTALEGTERRDPWRLMHRGTPNYSSEHSAEDAHLQFQMRIFGNL